MNPTRTSNDHLIVEALLHEENGERLLLLRFEAVDRSDIEASAPLQLALVIDRSGSMSGEKIEIAKQSALDMVDTLTENDRVGIVIYDDHVDLLQNPEAPSDQMRQLIRGIYSRGSTNLHGGWLTGVRLLPSGGHVVLLSDGLANVGQFVDAASLACEAETAARLHGVTTTTIGIGLDYDERLMTMMAESGRGAHYFARTPASIRQAFAHERFLMLSTAITDLQVEWSGGSLDIPRLVDAEVRHKVIVNPSKRARSLRIRYRDAKTGDTHNLSLRVPDESTVEPQATAQLLAQQSGDLMRRTLDLNSEQAARALMQEARDLRERVVTHPLADGELLRDVLRTLDQLIQEAEQLSWRYSEEMAHLSRKRARGRHLFLEASMHSFSDEEVWSPRSSEYLQFQMRPNDSDDLREIANRLPEEEWRRLQAAPVGFEGRLLILACTDPRDGLAAGRVGRILGVRAVPDRRIYTPEEIDRLLDALFPKP